MLNLEDRRSVGESMLAEERTVSAKKRDMSPVVICRAGKTETIRMRWGLEPVAPGGDPIILIRADGRAFRAEERCLIAANSLPLTDPDKRQWEVTLEEDGPFFCFAGIWRGATPTWPASYAALTIPAYPDLARIKHRHLAFMPRRLWADWLGGVPAGELLQPLPKGSLRVTPVGRAGAIGDLFA